MQSRSRNLPNGKTSFGADQEHAKFQQALAFHANGQVALAQAHCEDILTTQPKHAGAFHLLGVIAAQTRNPQKAVELIDKAIALDPSNAVFYSHRGIALKALKQFDAAVASYDRAIAIRPNYAEAYSNRGVALVELRRLGAAVESFDQAIVLMPASAEAHYNRGLALHELQQLDAAVASYDRAISIKPNYAEAYCSRGIALKELKQLNAAVASYERAIVIRPSYAIAHHNRGVALQGLDRFEAAVASYDKAIIIKPDYAEAYYNRGNALAELVQFDKSEESYRKALEINHDYILAKWALTFLYSRPPSMDNESQKIAREEFKGALEELDEWFTPSRTKIAYEAVGTSQPFYLAYYECNNKELLFKYGAICNRIMSHWQSVNKIEPTSLSNYGKVRVGIVSSHILEHSVWNAIVKGLVLNLNLERFELHIFHLSDEADQETILARSRATTFAQGRRSLTEWVTAIIEEKIEVLIFPEVGMDSLTIRIANLRLAPIQMATWGHPETTGFPTIDYYISADLFEGDGANDAYTERLVKLPNLGCSYSRLSISPVQPDVEKLHLDIDIPILLCPGAPFKYASQYDWVFVEIAKHLGNCQFVFFVAQRWSALTVESRLRKVFKEAGLDSDKYLVFIPWLNRQDFHGLMRLSDVFLDTIGFSGFNTAIQAIDCELPVVTREGGFMRGRLASGILKRMGMSVLIAGTEEEYISLVVRLVQDKNYHRQIRDSILERRHILYDDFEPIRGLESFLLDVCRTSK